jgi:hypothetical protein
LATPVYRPLLLNHLLPADLSSIKVRLPSHAKVGANDLVWTSYIFSKHSDMLLCYIDFRESFSAALLKGSFDDAERILDNCQDRLGMSLWLIESRVSLLQARDGLAAQRAYLEELVQTSGVDRVAAYLAYWYSFRSDPSVSRSTINVELETVQTGFGIASPASDFFGFCLDANNSGKVGDPINVVYAADTLPLVDRYNVMVRMLLLIAARGCLDASWAPTVSRLLTVLSDPLLRTWHVKAQGITLELTERDLSVMQTFDDYTRGDYSSVIRRAEEDFATNTTSSPFFEVYGRACALAGHDAAILNAESLLGQSLKATQQLSTYGDGGDTATERLSRLAIMFPFSVVGMELAAISEGTHRFSKAPDNTEADLVWTLASSPGNPWHFDALTELAPELVTHAIEPRLRDSPSLSLRDAVVLGDIAGFEDLALRWKLPQDRANIARGHIFSLNGQLGTAIEYYSLAAKSDIPLMTLTARSFQFPALVEATDYEGALRVFCDAYYSNSLSWGLFEISSLLSLLQEKGDDQIHTVPFANAAYITMLEVDQTYDWLVSDSYERCIHALRVGRPTELLTAENTHNADIRFFLRNVCSIRVMEDATSFDDLAEVEQERVSILSWLSTHGGDKDPTVEQEIRSVVRNAQITTVRDQLEQAKVYVDELGIRNKLGPFLKERYARFIRLSENPEVDFKSDQITKRLGQLFEGVGTVAGVNVSAELSKIRLPSTEKNGLLADTFVEVLEWFLLSPEFGLDAHLSSNVRHGNFVGHVLSPFSKRKLFASDDELAANGRVLAIWQDLLENLSPSLLEHVVAALKTFRIRVDTLANEVNDELLHIKLTKTRGMFIFEQQPEVQEEIASRLSVRSSFDEFVEVFFSVAWQQADTSMTSIREYLAGEFSSKIYGYCARLEQTLESKILRDEAAPLFDAIVEARTDFGATIARVAEWFHRPQRSTDEPFTLDLVVAVAIKEIQSCYPDKPFTSHENVDTSLMIKGRKLDGCVEILFILIQNALERSGDVDEQHIEIGVISDAKTLVFSVSNKLSDQVDIRERRSTADLAEKRYNGKEALSRVRGEGGSGLSKVWRTAEYNLQVEHSLSLTVGDNSVFLAEVAIDIENIS